MWTLHFYFQEVLPIGRKLGERVLQICAAKVKPYLVEVIGKMGTSIDDYSEVVASLCKDADGDVEQNEVQDCHENMVRFLSVSKLKQCKVIVLLC